MKSYKGINYYQDHGFVYELVSDMRLAKTETQLKTMIDSRGIDKIWANIKKLVPLSTYILMRGLR